MKKSSFSIFILLLAQFAVPLQGQNLDSLYAVWQDQSQPDSTRVKAYADYIWDGFVYYNPDTAEILANDLYRFSEKGNYPQAAAKCFNILGEISFWRGNFPLALEYRQKSMEFYVEMGDKQGISNSLSSMGKIYASQGNSLRALEYLQQSIKIFEEIGDRQGVSNSLNNIGNVYQFQGNYPRALEYYEKKLKISEELHDKEGIAIGLINIGEIYMNQGNFPRSLEYLEQSLILFEELHDKIGVAMCLNAIGEVYMNKGNYPRALEYLEQSLNLFKELRDKRSIAMCMNNIGNIYKNQGNNSGAIDYCKNGLALAEEIKVLIQQKNACQCLYDTYKAMGKGKETLLYLEKIQVIDDSLNTEETVKKLQQMEFHKEMFADSIAKAEIARLIEYAHQEEIRQKNQTRNWTIAGGFLALLLAGGFYSRWRYVRKSRNIISKERDRSDNLLLNILPADIAAELKEKGKADARDFDLVSILFTDFKGFTAASEKLSAQDLVSEINTCFEAFDGIMTRYGIEKIKIIGDAYMAAGGLPVPSDDSMKKTVLAALDIQAFIINRKAKMEAQNKPAFEMRAGIHTGSVVAGIVGVKKFQYDIWGDTVNTASRMESNGEVGKVNISQATYNLLKDDPDFSFESRGKIEAKGKGEIEMYFVTKT